VKMLITIPIELQEILLAASDPISPKYRMLTNSLIESDGRGRKVVKILCDMEEAKDLLAWADEQRPGAAASIIVTQALTRRK
jgi:hypothetical protein